MIIKIIIRRILFQRTTIAGVVSESERPMLTKYSRRRAQLIAPSSQVQLLAFTWQNCLY